jgi:predicted HicB family RNase H-like nuclease
VAQRNSVKPRSDQSTETGSNGLRLYAQLGLRVPAELAVRLKRYCRESGKSANKAVMEALTRYLAQNGR